jgi:hypothetical protein
MFQLASAGSRNRLEVPFLRIYTDVVVPFAVIIRADHKIDTYILQNSLTHARSIIRLFISGLEPAEIEVKVIKTY